MSRVCLLSFAALLVCGSAHEDSSPPHQQLPPKKVTASEGVTATLRCLFNGKTPPKITWKFRQLALLLQDENAGTRYEYSVPNNTAPPTDKRYNWVHEQFTPCSATCGGGFQTRDVTCRSREEPKIVDDSLCNEGLKPPTNQSCNPDSCFAQWVEGPWGECSQRCGRGGVWSREITCQRVIANGAKSIVPDKDCFDLLGPKPEVFQKCNEDAPCPTWLVGRWRPCDKLCGEGKQTRLVVCYQQIKGRPIELLDDDDCYTERKPEEEQSCMMQPCEVDWVTSSWSGCDTCTSKFRTRMVVCATENGLAMNESFCSYFNRPVDHEKCNKDELPTCEVQWYITHWSKCSVNCGEGVQTRKVYCGMYYEDASGGGVKMVEDALCANLTKYNDTKACTVPKEECPSQWFAGTWSDCSEKGEQFRRVMCLRGNKKAADCDGTTKLNSVQPCNPRTSCSDVPLTPQAVPPKELDPAASGGEVTIDGNEGRYRLLSDGALEIVSLYRNDTGVYICVADYGLGVATQEIHLVVNEPVRMPAGICGGTNDWVIGELYRPFQVCCSAYGFPPPSVEWYHSNERSTLLYNDTVYEPRGNVLLIRNLKIANLGTYTCKACNGVRQPALWKVVVRAYKPVGLFYGNELLVSRDTVAPSLGTQCLTTAETTTTITLRTTEAPKLLVSETSTATENTTGSSEFITSTPISTTNEGIADVIATLDPCSSFEFGCCADNETEASGPDGQGCPCNATEFGCCPDDVSTEPVRMPAGICGGTNDWVIGELYRPFQVCCSAYGFPPPSVEWYHSNERKTLLYNDTVYEPRGNVLLIRNLKIANLGTYTCKACNGVRQPALWKVVVRAYKPGGLFYGNELLVSRDTVAPSLGSQCFTTAETTTTTILRTTEAPKLLVSETSTATENTTGSSEFITSTPISTTNEGIADVIATLDPCSSFEFGCCADNETEASGPDRQGCPCNATEFGCCPDGVSPETSTATENTTGSSEFITSTPISTTNEGIADVIATLDPCSSFEFGCCADNETEASGPDRQGCPCNATEFGCCPDGVSPEPVRMPVGICGGKNDWVIGELGSPLEVRCLAYGYPPPSVFWYRGYNEAMVPYNNAVYLARGNILLIRSLAIETLGQYTCQAYNGEGKAASWVVFVRAYQPEEYFIENELLVPRNTLPLRPRTQPPSTAETTTTTTTTTETPRPLFTVPVSTHVSKPYSTLYSGADLRLTCDVDGFPEPDVHWTKDGATIQADGRITITGTVVSRLTVARVSDADAGLYACHASNQYSSQSDTAQINVQQLVIPANCTDNPYFANCNQIVRSKFCRHKYYSKFCCKSCMEAGQLDPQDVELQAASPIGRR